MWGTSLKSPPLHHDLSYVRRFVLLPSGSPTRRGLIVCVQCEHWMRTSTDLPCGEGRTNCWYATVPQRRGFQADPQLVDSGCHHSCQWVLWSPLTIGGQGSLYKKYGGLQRLSGRFTYAGYLRRCWVVYSPHVRQVLRPLLALLFSCHSCAFPHYAGICKSGGMNISFP